MTLTPSDNAWSAALGEALGHAAPFTDEECAKLQALRLRGARDLSFLQHCSGLRSLSIVGSEIADLAPLRALELRSLSLVATEVSDLGVLADCRTIEELDVIFCSATDLAPVIAIAGLKRTRLMGNPWSNESWAARDQLWKAASARDMAPPLTEFSTPLDRETTVRFRNKGLRLSFHTIAGVVGAVVRPGVARLGKGELDSVVTGAAFILVDASQQPNPTAESLMERWSQMEGEAPPLDLNRLDSGIVVGSSQDALGWINSSQLDAKDREHLSRFVRRFPQLTFYRDTIGRLDRLQETLEQKVKLPDWLRLQRTVLAGVQPWSLVGLRFDAFDQSTLGDDHIEESWHEVELYGYDLDTRRELLHGGASVYPVGQWQDRSTFAISLSDESERQIYEFYEIDLEEARSAGRSLRRNMSPAFDSWTSMLGHVIALRIDGKIEVAADGAS